MALTKRTNWKELISSEMESHKDSWDNVAYSTLTDEELNKEFDCSYGIAEGSPFTLWTTTRVYFPVQYDGAEWCESVSRNPCAVKTYHLGGG